MTEENIKDLSKLTEALNGFVTTEGKEEAIGDQSSENKKKRAKPSIKEREYSDDTEKKIYTQRCSNPTISAEAILISEAPRFLVLNKIDSTISIQNFINLGSVIYLPPESTSYMNKPYSFSSEVQVNEYIYKTRKENLDSLYKKVKAICKKYIEADDFHISMCAADII